MKMLFKEFLKTYKKRSSYRDLTIKFNQWVGKKEVSDGIKKFNFKAHTNKFMVRKWCEKLDIDVTKK